MDDTPGRTVLLTSARSDGGRRDDLWRYCEAFWRDAGIDWDLFEGRDDGDGPFCRGRLLNEAADAAGEWDVAVVLDRDVVLDPDRLRAGVDLARRTGRMVLPYGRYVPLDEAMTDRVLAGFDGNWTTGIDRAAKVMRHHVSSVVVVPRPLWDRIGGFDPRLQGWGCDDVIFAHAAKVHGGKVERLAGDVFHLWHPWSAERDLTSRNFLLGDRLSRRYHRARTPAEVDEVRATDDDDRTLVVVMGHGRADCIKRAVASVGEQVSGNIARRVISDDSGDADYRADLAEQFPDWEVVGTDSRRGFGGHVRDVFGLAADSGLPYLFLVEEDFTFNRPVDLAEMATVLVTHPHLAQMALRRQAWFPNELAAGGVVEEHPDRYSDCGDGVAEWLEHRLFFTTNPSLIPAATVRRGWPTGAHSEARFARRLFTGNRTACGYWGARSDDPWVHHDGERTGYGY